jgi:hypothetical protein
MLKFFVEFNPFQWESGLRARYNATLDMSYLPFPPGYWTDGFRDSYRAARHDFAHCGCNPKMTSGYSPA